MDLQRNQEEREEACQALLHVTPPFVDAIWQSNEREKALQEGSESVGRIVRPRDERGSIRTAS